ncbi:hypothetical protein glysoja_038086 [Glycine soja]|uniref:RNase H type-1 domain-containing protein n=1 Tax=Glycine soja TaxID=3848 RepID=A0A0B2PY14_GLYSO|nr:hypothetical protein JHK87_022259 [Glycine soja]KHN14030.1 hypothetical protein glysoja_038086 [Glycine soja]
MVAWGLNVGTGCGRTTSNSKGRGVVITLEGPDNISIEQSVKYNWKPIHNQAEYIALITGLNLAIEVGIKKLKCQSNSKLVTEQGNEVFQAKEEKM